MQEVGRQPLDRVQLAALLVQARDRLEETLGVRVRGGLVDLVHGRGLDDAARVHDGDLVRDVGDHAEVVGDEDQAHVVLALQLREQVHDLGLHRHVERRGGLVGDDQLGFEGERHRDHDALAHPAGELVRVLAHAFLGGGDADPLHEFDGLGAGVLLGHALVDGEHLAELLADGEDGVERGERVLEDHRDLRAAHLAPPVLLHPQQVLALEEDLAGGDTAGRHVEDAHDRLGGDGLPRARLAEHGEGLARVDVVADPVDGLDDAVPGRELDVQVSHFQQHGGLLSAAWGRGRRAPRRRA
ncbi:putative peptide transport system ATP-binding protein [Streptomyces sp. Tu6071]|nr:putative peptide transport system ATP-binding protein [Streptomyces sp. Tu6071]